jgi:ATP-dependent DNA ligase
MIVIEKDGHKMVPFGMNKVVALDKDNSEQRLCYKIFDILWLKEEEEDINLMKYPLKQRK